MKILYKDKENFKKLVMLKGYTLNSLSLKIGKCRQHLGQSLKIGTIGAESAKRIAEVLNEEHSSLFKIG